MSKSNRRIYVGSTFSAWGREWTVVERQTRAREGVMYVIEDAGGHREARTRDTLLSVMEPRGGKMKIGDVVPCPVLMGEIVSGDAAGLPSEYVLRGVGLCRTRDLRSAEELTEFCNPDDTEWAAEIISLRLGGDRRFVEACEQAQRIATRTGKQMRVYRAYQQFSVKHADLPWYGQHLTLINP